MIYLNKKPLLEESFNSFVRSIEIAYALTEETKLVPSEDNRNTKRNKEDDPWISKMIDTHYNDIRELKKTTQSLKELINSNKNQDQYEKEMDKKRFEDLKNVSYEPLTVTKQNRPFTSYSFPFNILYLAKQVFIWIGNFLTRAFAKIAELVASLTGNKMQATISLAKDAFIKEEEFMKGTYLPIAFKSEREGIQKIGQSEMITYGSRISDREKYIVKEDLDLLSEAYDSREREQSKFVVYDMSSTLTELKKYMATFLQFYDTMQGSFGENLVDVGDIEQLYSLFYEQLEAIKIIKSGGGISVDPNLKEKDLAKKERRDGKSSQDIVDIIKKSYAQLEFRIDPRKIKGILDTTLANTDRLKQTYKIVEKKVIDILGELLNYQSNLFKQTGKVYSAFSGETMSEMILLTHMYEEKISALTSQIRVINETKNKLNNLLKGFSNISGIFSGYNIAQIGNYQSETGTSGTEITKISNDIRQVVVMLIQTVQLRYDNAYRYLDVMTSIKDLIVSVSSINANRDKYLS